ncbi:signal transduction histidine kinase [Catenulispora sp. GAS73]|uniref:sensor histidine kinase n=1 Tax=Catenulispora sp. GAS73 TaxID=3156269 RepID=UPI003516B3DC
MTPESRPLISRVAPRHWVALDQAAAVVIGVGTYVGERAAAPDRPAWLLAALAVAASAPLAVRRRWPLAVLLSVAAASLGLAAINAAPLVNLSYATYTVATTATARRALIAGAATLGCLAAGMRLQNPAPNLGTHLQSAAIVLATVWALALLIRQHRANTVLVAAQATGRLQEHVLQERMRIARDLHDVVAHSMSLIAVQAGVAGYVMDRRPEQATTALAAIESTSRTALVELRRLLGVLRAEADDAELTDPAELAPAPGLAELSELAARTGEAGLRVTLDQRLAAADVPAGVQVTVYRIVQEALTNVIKHTRAAEAHVTVGDRDNGLEAVISNGPGRRERSLALLAPRADLWRGSGHGLIGMRERAALCGGRLDAGSTADGGFRVSVWLPLDRRAPAADPMTSSTSSGPR